MMMIPYSLYLHIPFCATRCSYCDFNTSANRIHDIPRYVKALIDEIETTVKGFSEPLAAHSIYFGGGTPALMFLDDFEKIMICLREQFKIHEDVEVTLEANPGLIDRRTVGGFKKRGVNRLSLGMQSADPGLLKLLGRRHTQIEVIQTVTAARSVGINNISLDLIFGIPTQTMRNWQDSVKQVIDLNVEHISLYALTLEYGTALYRRVGKGLIPPIDDDLAADMYELAGEMLESAGYESYEISNWARRDKEGRLQSSRHNLQYWRNFPYLGFGAGAHGYANGLRLENVSDIDAYIQRQNKKVKPDFPEGLATAKVVPINETEEMRETMMVGLRLTVEGVSKGAFQSRFGKTILDVFRNEIDELIQNGLVEWAGVEGEILRLTKRGRLLGNRVFMQFVGDSDDQATITGVP